MRQANSLAFQASQSMEVDMLRRRGFIAGALSIPLASLSYAANEQMGYPSPIGVPRRAWVTNPQLVRQQCPQWCWAASIAMIFDSFGHPIDQQTIVQATFGAMVCAPSGNTLTIAQDLSRTWTDTNGVTFGSVVTAAYDPMNGINSLSNSYIVDQLSNDRPLLYCNKHHAMVLVALDYLDTLNGPQPQKGGVLDPWPMAPGFHALNPSEMYMSHLGGDLTFLAAVDVS
jgi:hypothetical protein